LNQKQVNISSLEVKHALVKLQKKKSQMVCGNERFNSISYLRCLERVGLQKPTIQNLNALAQGYIQQGFYERAIETYELSKQKGSKEAVYALANLYIEQLHQHNKAKALFQTILTYKDSTCQIGEMLALQSDFSAFSFYDKQIYKGNKKAYICKGLLHVKRQNYYRAEHVYKKASAQGLSQAYYYLGNLYSAYIPQIHKEIHAYTKVAQSNDELSVHAMFNLAMAYSSSLHRYDDAIYWYVKAIEKGNKQSWLALAQVYKTLKDNQMVETVYQTMASLNEVDGYLALRNYYSNQKAYAKAKRVLKQCSQKGHNQCVFLYTKLYEQT
jgi:tetratricopeptide (TPR) repeat protein